MRGDSFRFGVVIGMLALGAASAHALRLVGNREPEAPRPVGSAPRYVVHTDVAGWYRITPDERAIASPYDLRLDALPGALPLELGSWRGEELEADQDIETWFGKPDLVIRRRYVDQAGAPVWLTVIGSRGAKSYRIFEHTPRICYPSAGWAVQSDDSQRVPLGRSALPVRCGVFEREGAVRVVYAWYQWDGPERDPGVGITSWRLTADATDGIEPAQARLDGFLGLLFQETLPWHRF